MAVLRTALASHDVRRLLVGWLLTTVGTWAFTILIALYAYQEGGATAVGVAVLVRMLPSGLAAPSVALLADRHSRRSVLVASSALRALVLALISAAVAAEAPFAFVLALSAVFTVAGTAHKPAQAALLPQLARMPAEVAAANAASSGIDNAGFLAGSLMAGVVAGALGLAGGMAVCVLPYLAAAGILALLPRDERPAAIPGAEQPSGISELLEGFRTVSGDREMSLLTGMFAANMFVQGVVDVLLVLAAIELLGMGESGVGWLNSAWGVGGLAGSLVALSLLGRGRLAEGLSVGSVLAGLPLVVLGVVHVPAAALALLVVLGVGYALTEVAMLTFTQRLAADDVLARVFGVQETLFVVATALGSLLAAGLVGLMGIEASLIVTGAALPVLAVALWRRLEALEAGVVVPARAYALLRALPMFAPLPIATIENLAAHSETESHEAGAEIIRQGDHGEGFWVIDEGTVDVSVDGRKIAQRSAGECLGEIALLRDTPRTATVVAATPLRLIALTRSHFIGGVSAHPRSVHEAETLVDERLEVVPGGLPAAVGGEPGAEFAD